MALFQAWPPSTPPLPGSVFLFLYFEAPVKNKQKKKLCQKGRPLLNLPLDILLFFLANPPNTPHAITIPTMSLCDQIFSLSCIRRLKNISTAKKKRERNKGFAGVADCVQKSRETKEHKAGFVCQGCLQLANNQTAHRSWLVGGLTQSQPVERLVKQQSRAGDQGDLHSRALRPVFLCNEDVQRTLFFRALI